MKRVAGIRLVMKAALTVCVMEDGEFLNVLDRRGTRIGVRIIMSVSNMKVLRSNVVSITSTWICTKMGGS